MVTHAIFAAAGFVAASFCPDLGRKVKAYLGSEAAKAELAAINQVKSKVS
jgi:hypothetical protein